MPTPRSAIKSSSARRPTRRAPRADSSPKVRIRMYDVGFGDCFLLLVPSEDGYRKILFDCGSIAIGSVPLDKVVTRVIEDVKDSDGVPRIDVVVATHRHKDHVEGFANAAWQRVEVKEVWLPWTENPEDPLAAEIRSAQSSLALHLGAALDLRLGVAGLGAAERGLLEGYRLMANNAMSNEQAMETLHDGFRRRALRRFLPTPVAGEATFETEALPEVIVHVLGPSRDERVIRDMDPPAGRSYLRMIEDRNKAGGVPEPFSGSWWVEPEELGSVNAGHLVLSPEDRRAIDQVGTGLEETLAATLENSVNGTSLMLLLQIGGSYLLFPGDAQWGTWQSAMVDPDWRKLMQRTIFYKIGHHGSHNATPKEFVEQIVGRDFWAMASTRHRGSWPIPKPELMTALHKRSKKIARSDEMKKVKAPFTASAGYVEASIPV